MINRVAIRPASALLLAAALLSLTACGKKGTPDPIQASESPTGASQLAAGEGQPSPVSAAVLPAETQAVAPILAETSASLPAQTDGATQTLAASEDGSSASANQVPQEPAVPLSESSSPYLRAAAEMPVRWSSWGEEPFRRAATEQKPMLICIGANWSHSCKSMDSGTYADQEIAGILNEHFVTIRVDRDERPDLDDRYQAAHALINRKAGGYPLTVFALPDGRPFESLGFVAPEAADGQAGMKQVLQQILQITTERRADAETMAAAVEKALLTGGEAGARAPLDEKLVHRLHAAVAREYDPKSETFGKSGQPKFPAATAALAMLQYYSDFNDSRALGSAADALSRYFRSGLRDNVMGGYFRYAEDEELRRPRFEKLLAIQAEMLSANALAYAATGKYLYKEAANDVLRFVRDTFESRDGGFFATQDADLGREDNGAYFTWSAKEVESIVGKGKDAQVFVRYLNVPPSGRGTLFPTSKMQGVADALKIPRDEAIRHLDEVRAKLHEARMQEDAPYVNKALVASWNSAMIGAYLDAYKYLGDIEARDFALKSATYLMANMISPERGVARVFYKGTASGYGFLDDNVRMVEALLQCFEVSGRHEYLATAVSLMEFVEARFLDPATGLYLDRVDAAPLGLLKVARRPVADSATPSANAVAALNWYRLYQLTMTPEYQQRAERLVTTAAAQPGLEGLSAATLSRAAALLVNGAPKVLVVGPLDDENTKKLHEAALPVFRMGKVVEVLSPEEAEKTDYKPAKDGKPITYVCTVGTCAPPVRDADKLPGVVRTFARPANESGQTAAGETRTADAGAGRRLAESDEE